MRTIWKFELEIKDEQIIRMPIDALLLQTVQIQNNKVVIWAMCTPSDVMDEITIITLGTGNRVPDVMMDEKLQYIGTYQMGGFVGHVFIKK